MRFILFSLMVSSIFLFTPSGPTQAISSKQVASLCEGYVENNFTGNSTNDFACVSYFIGLIDASNHACRILGIQESISSDDFTKLKLKQSKNMLGSSASGVDVDNIIVNFLAWFEQNTDLANLPPTVGTEDWLTKKWGCK